MSADMYKTTTMHAKYLELQKMFHLITSVWYKNKN